MRGVLLLLLLLLCAMTAHAGGDPTLCTDEIIVRQFWLDRFHDNDRFKRRQGWRHASKLLRMAFHDAIDARCEAPGADTPCILSNLQANGPTSAPPPLGVDFCLHTARTSLDDAGNVDPLAENDDGNPDHNRGLAPTRDLILDMGKAFPLRSLPDLMALGAVMVVEGFANADGARDLHMHFKWGRRKGSCEGSIMCSGDHCIDNEKWFLDCTLGNPEMRYKHYSPLDPTSNIRAFECMGFNRTEMMALMGAHSFGGVNRCTGTSQGLFAEVFCPVTKEKYLDLPPPAAPCDRNCKRDFKQAVADRLRQTFFDSTPGKLDNQYFRELRAAYESKGADTVACRGLDDAGDYAAEYCGTDHQVCVAARKPSRSVTKQADVRMRYLQNVSTPCEGFDPATPKQGTCLRGGGDEHGPAWRPMAYLAADWAMMEDPRASALAAQFGADEGAFHRAFAAAYRKVLNFGYDEAAELRACRAVACHPGAGGFAECGGLAFRCGAWPQAGVPASCELIGGFAAGGRLACDGREYVCAYQKGPEYTPLMGAPEHGDAAATPSLAPVPGSDYRVVLWWPLLGGTIAVTVALVVALLGLCYLVHTHRADARTRPMLSGAVTDEKATPSPGESP